jgi:PAS domain S-box-containing protein
VVESGRTAVVDQGDTQLLEILNDWSQGFAVRQGSRLVYVNRSFATLCGYETAEQLLSLGAATLHLPESERERMDRYYAARAQGGDAPATYDLQMTRRDGSLWWAETRAQSVVWNGEPATMMAISDITERKRSEDALNESEHRFRSLVEGSIQGMIVSRGTDVLFANEKSARILGYESLQEIRGAGTLEKHIHPADRKEMEARAAARLRGEPVHTSNIIRALRKNGSDIWLEARATLVEWDGKPAIQSVFYDVTDRREVELALSASERRFRNLVEGSVQGLIVHVDGKPKFANQALADILGYDGPADILRVKSADELIHPKDIALVYSSRRARLHGEKAPAVLEHRAVRKDGSAVWVEVRPTVVEWDGEQAIHYVIVDISERKRMEESLLESQARFRDYAEMAADWIWETNAQHRLSFMSDRYYELTGYTPEDVMDKSRQNAPALSHHTEAVRSLLSLMDKQEPYRDYPLHLKTADGGVMYTITSGRPVFDDDGSFQGFRGTSTDHTARKQAEDALRQARDELEVKVETRTRELSKEVAERQLAQQAATQASHAKSEFLSSMSHELRTPLNAILGFGQLLRDYSDKPLSEEQATNIEHILGASKHLLGLINDILDLSRIEGGHLNLSFQAIDLTHCIQDCLALVRPLADEREISIVDMCDAAAGLHLWADPTRLKQVMLNVISNAVKYNRDRGSVTVSAAALESGMIRIDVADTGLGIPFEKHADVFRPFSRLGAEASEIEGTGIGLTISRQLIESMAGRLDFDSTLGEGSTFWIDVPMAED